MAGSGSRRRLPPPHLRQAGASSSKQVKSSSSYGVSAGASVLFAVILLVTIVTVFFADTSSLSSSLSSSASAAAPGRRSLSESNSAGDLPPGRRHDHYMSEDQTETPPQLRWKVINRFPHDAAAFTQGLEYHHGYLWEGTGLYGESNMRKVVVETGEVLLQKDIDRSFFGEGITVIDDERVVQLVWKKKQGYTYTFPDLQPTGRFNFETHNGEGWGICDDGDKLVVTDGTGYLSFWDRTTLAKTSEIQVTDPEFLIAAIEPSRRGHNPTRLNEIECVEGEILANVWYKDYVLRIDPSTGHVIGVLDFTTLWPGSERRTAGADVLNGIAYDPAGSSEEDGYRRLFITGKKWNRLYEVHWYP